MRHAQWVFDCDVPLDEFQARMAAALRRSGWAVGPAQVYDFAAARGSVRAYVKLRPHAQGVEVLAKVKAGWPAPPWRPEEVLWLVAREAQLAGSGAGRPPPAPAVPPRPGP